MRELYLNTGITDFWKDFVSKDTIHRQNYIHALADNLMASYTIEDPVARRIAFEAILLSYFNDIISYYEGDNIEW